MEITTNSKNITCQASYEACLLAVKKAEELGIKINVSIVDSSGIEMSFLRMNDAFIHSIDIAKDKAYTSASFGFPTDTWTQVFKDMPHLEQGFSNRERLIPFGGGLPIFVNNEKIGAIGISGGTEEEDIICAKYALKELGL